MKLEFIWLAPALLAGSMALSQPTSGAQAQGAQTQSTPRPAPLLSPVIQPDGNITFNLYAPTATTVSVNGQLYPAMKKGSQAGAPMTKDDKGIWSVTLGPFPAAFYSYHFIVDGVQALDPINRHVAYGDNWFIVPGAATADFLYNDVPHGTVSLVWYPSPTLGMARRRLTIYLPPGYEDSNARYPVLYLLHGGNASEHTWWESGRVPEVLDNLIAQGKAVPMIVVLPNGNETQIMTNAEADTPSTNFGPPMGQPAQPRPQGAGGQGGPGGPGGPGQQPTSQKFPDSIANDIIPYIDKHYRTKADREDRAVTGLSLGAGQAVLTAFHHPDDFAWAGVFGGDLAQIPTLAPGVAARMHPFYWSNSNEQDSATIQNGKKTLDAAGIKYIQDSHPEYSSEFWRPGLAAYVSQLFKPVP